MGSYGRRIIQDKYFCLYQKLSSLQPQHLRHNLEGWNAGWKIRSYKNYANGTDCPSACIRNDQAESAIGKLCLIFWTRSQSKRHFRKDRCLSSYLQPLSFLLSYAHSHGGRNLRDGFLTHHVSRAFFLLWREDGKEVSREVWKCGWHLGILNIISLWFWMGLSKSLHCGFGVRHRFKS